jgi:hypothetical protein
MWEKILNQGLVAAAFSATLSVLYNRIYKFSFYVDFSSVINIGSITGACTLACGGIAVGHYLSFKWKGEKLSGVYNVCVFIVSFFSSLAVLAFRLPLDVGSPELFPGLAIPLHFFPALAYFSIAPFFKLRTDQAS